MEALRVIFMGTAEIACPSLGPLCASPDVSVVAVVTQPDRPKGRDLKVQPSAVKQLAVEKRVLVLQPERARQAEFVRQLGDFRPDLIAVMAFGQILPPAILDLPRFGCVNVHTSLLPKYRGAELAAGFPRAGGEPRRARPTRDFARISSARAG